MRLHLLAEGHNLLFVYGTLTDPSTRRKAIGGQQPNERTVLDGWSKINRLVDGRTYPTIVRARAGHTPGMMLVLSDEELKKVDEWEKNYKRTTVRLRNGRYAYAYQLDGKPAVKDEDKIPGLQNQDPIDYDVIKSNN